MNFLILLNISAVTKKIVYFLFGETKNNFQSYAF